MSTPKDLQYAEIFSLINSIKVIVEDYNKVYKILADIKEDMIKYMKIINASMKNDIKIPKFTIENYERIFEEHKSLLRNFRNEWAEIKPF